MARSRSHLHVTTARHGALLAATSPIAFAPCIPLSAVRPRLRATCGTSCVPRRPHPPVIRAAATNGDPPADPDPTPTDATRREASSKRDPVALGLADDFDRDYYTALKAEFADTPGINIYGKDDYELTDIDVPWLEDNRGRDLSTLARTAASRPVPPGLSVAPMLNTDMQTQEDVDKFVERAASYDPTSGVFWRDVPHDMHLVEERDFSDFRHDDEVYDMDHRPTGLSFEPLEQVVHDDELTRLRASLDALQGAEADAVEMKPVVALARDDHVPVPSRADVEKWAAAEEKRGGCATENESHALPPLIHTGAAATVDDGHAPTRDEVPLQFTSAAQAHVGRWRGEVRLITLAFAANDIHVTGGDDVIATIESDIDISDATALVWETACDATRECDDDFSHISSINFGVAEEGEHLAPGRAVFSCGSYVAQRRAEEKPPLPAFSLSTRCVAALTSADVAPVVELCMLHGEGVDAVRTRVLLCTSTQPESGGKRARGAYFRHVIAIRETREEASSVAGVHADAGTMVGCWTGGGISLHPEYPQLASMHIHSTQYWRTARVALSDVTWEVADDHSQTNPSAKEQYSVAAHGSRNQRRSKRVRAAVAHDKRRLDACQLLCTSTLGDDERSHAWKSDERAMYSPRVGRFVSDHFALRLQGGLLLMAPVRAVWNARDVVELAEMFAPVRRRIVAARSAMGDLVGAALLCERLEDSGMESVDEDGTI